MLKFIPGKSQANVIIIGTGIAGCSLAYNLEKRKIPYEICTEKINPLSNTSSLSNGHFRIPTEENREETIKISVMNKGENVERAKHIYEKADIVRELLEELNVKYEKRSFGVLPEGKLRGGYQILSALQKGISTINNGTKLTNFHINQDNIEVNLEKNGTVYSKYANVLVLATGGFGGQFPNNDNISYENSHIFDIVRKNGGNIKNIETLFIHPFGYNRGKRILIGKEAKGGEFLDEASNYIFPDYLRKAIKEDNYHEKFEDLLLILNKREINKEKTYFVTNEKKIQITTTVHYTAGGIETNYEGKVKNCSNLYAIGECRADGNKHGGRLPGYAFTAAVVDGYYLAEKIANEYHISESL